MEKQLSRKLTRTCLSSNWLRRKPQHLHRVSLSLLTMTRMTDCLQKYHQSQKVLNLPIKLISVGARFSNQLYNL